MVNPQFTLPLPAAKQPSAQHRGQQRAGTDTQDQQGQAGPVDSSGCQPSVQKAPAVEGGLLQAALPGYRPDEC